MATYLVGISREEPAERVSTAPVHCLTCDQEWDRDEDDDQFDEIDGNIYCNRNSGNDCASNATKEAYRAQAADIMRTHIRDAREELAALYVSYPCEIDSEGVPLQLLDDVEMRTNLFALDAETGFRNDGIQISYFEFCDLRRTIQAAQLTLARTEIGSELLKYSSVFGLLNTWYDRTSKGGAM